MTQKIQLGVHGAAGKMGRRIVAVGHQTPEMKVAAALESAACPLLGHDAGDLAGIGALGVPVSSELKGPLDVIIDFSVPEATAKIAALCAEKKIPLVVATTGLSAAQKAAVADAAKSTAVLQSPSMSLAVNLTMKLVREAARALKDLPTGCDVEIIERHHRFKEDAPSGTALKFGEIVAQEMGQQNHVHGRSGRPGHRPHGEIGYHALRVGDNVGEHTIVFGMLGEAIDVTVRGHTRDSYAYGAIAAARFLAGKPAGMYSMADVLGF